MLPAADVEFLEAKAPGHSTALDSGMICVRVPEFVLPPGLSVRNADLLLRLSPGYPDVPPDMWWFYPGVFRADGSRIEATDSIEHYFGRDWQRWSRHLDPQRWMAGIDSLESYFALIASELHKAAKRMAA
ncbi:E2/UBC family protein [Mesorhizobium sp. M0664]|uniref:E2/UBC family protein n=1 Tax=unclassified Mesorhizobium TaxID=325217 RepID=UPI00333822BD